VVQARDGHDGVIEASVVIGNIRYTAVARVLSSCPDCAGPPSFLLDGGRSR
jgi:hypothetical protein